MVIKQAEVTCNAFYNCIIALVLCYQKELKIVEKRKKNTTK